MRKIRTLNIVICYVFAYVYLLPEVTVAQDINYCNGADVFDRKGLMKLKDCDVIEGNLVLRHKIFDSTLDWSMFGSLKVREITEFLLIYQVNYLQSLEVLFPNLTVIRGNDLFCNYALVIYGSADLMKIGLPSLVAIKRGSVNILSNLALNSYAETVNWDYITKWNNATVCTYPNHIQQDTISVYCNKTCQGDCWSENQCQKICPTGVAQCDLKGQRCHDQCLGGCSSPNDRTKCFACQRFRNGKSCEITCWPRVELDNYRCVSDGECLRMPGRKLLRVQNMGINHINKCVKECPSGYVEKMTNNETRCLKRADNSNEECSGGVIESYATAKLFSDCTVINGSLEIRISDGNMEFELRKQLKNIREVKGYVRVFKSDTLTNLHFLRNLKIIRGNILWKNNYSFIVHDNDNLKELWDGTDLEIIEGEPMFYANPQLCPNTINNLLGKQTWNEGIPILNGNKRACNINSNIIVTLVPEEDDVGVWMKVEFHYNTTGHDVLTSLAGFEVRYKKTDEVNLDYFGGQEWEYHFVKRNISISQDFRADLKYLAPDSLYGFYIETLTTEKSAVNLQSKIVYSKTLTFYPSLPINIRAFPVKNKDLEIVWDKPVMPNGTIFQYVITSVKKFIAKDHYESSNVCNFENEQPSREGYDEANNDDNSLHHWKPVTKSSFCASKTANSGSMAVLAKNRKENLEKTMVWFFFFKDKNVHLNSRAKRALKRKFSGPRAKALQRLNIDFLNSTFEEIERKLMEQKGTYKEYCRFLEDLVNFNPVSSRDDYFAELLKTAQCYKIMENVTESSTSPSELEVPDAPNPKILIRRIRSMPHNQLSAPIKLTVPSLREQRQSQQNGMVVVKNRKFIIKNVALSSYEIKIKACHKPQTGNVCVFPCKCSAEAIEKIDVVLDDKEFKARNVTVTIEPNGIRVNWIHPKLPFLENCKYYISIRAMQGFIQRLNCANASETETLFSFSSNKYDPGNYSVYVQVFSNTRRKILSSSDRVEFLLNVR